MAIRKSICSLSVAAMLATLLPTSVQGLSIVAARPHSPELACGAISRLVEQINQKKIEGQILFHTNALGDVDYDKLPAFLSDMTSRDGKPDKTGSKIYRVWLLDKDKFDPMYLVSLVRTSWHEDRFEDDGNGGHEALPPDYETDRSLWIASFSSDWVDRFHQADLLYPLMRKLPEIKGCHTN
jgi:hypothetical protein